MNTIRPVGLGRLSGRKLIRARRSGASRSINASTKPRNVVTSGSRSVSMRTDRRTQSCHRMSHCAVEMSSPITDPSSMAAIASNRRTSASVPADRTAIERHAPAGHRVVPRCKVECCEAACAVGARPFPGAGHFRVPFASGRSASPTVPQCVAAPFLAGRASCCKLDPPAGKECARSARRSGAGRHRDPVAVRIGRRSVLPRNLAVLRLTRTRRPERPAQRGSAA